MPTCRPLLIVLFASAALLGGFSATAQQRIPSVRERIHEYLSERAEAVAAIGAPTLTAAASELVKEANQLAREIQRRRRNDPEGSIFSPAAAADVRDQLERLLRSPLGTEVRDLLFDVQPDPFPVVVNARYPAGEPRSSMPQAVLDRLPPLPRLLEYRFRGRHLLLLDRSTRVIVDVVRDALPAAAAQSDGSRAAAGVSSSRAALVARAHVWEPSDISSKNLLVGPRGHGALPPLATVHCRYQHQDFDGASPKFACRLRGGDEVKVKYGGTNGEVYGEVAASRLLWALGFGADRMYPVRVVCTGCPEPLLQYRLLNGSMLFDPATIERDLRGAEIDDPHEGWAWETLRAIRPELGGAPRAHVDALRLLAAFLQHSDSKRDNQALVCRNEPATQSCPRPLLFIADLGLTFGRASWFNNPDESSVNLVAWKATPVWNAPERCVANLSGSATGTLQNPVISEAGRAFLSRLLMQLSDAQLRDLFTAARVDLRPRNPARGASGFPAVDEWVAAFTAKRRDIVEHTCPISHVTAGAVEVRGASQSALLAAARSLVHARR